MTTAATPNEPTTDITSDPNAAAGQPPAEGHPAEPTTVNVIVDGVEHAIPSDLASVTDPDLREHYQSLIDVSKEEAGTGDAGTATSSPTPAAPAAGPEANGKPTGQPAGGEPRMVPVTALQAERAKREEAIANANYYKGLAEGRVAPAAGTTPATATPAAPTPDEQLAALHSKQDALAAQFDNGEITMAQFKTQERALNQQEATIRETAFLAKMPQPQTAPAARTGDDLYLEEKTEEMEEQHPYAPLLFPKVLPADPYERDIIVSRGMLVRNEAVVELARTHPSLALSDDNPRAVMLLRQTMAKISDKYGPVWFPEAKVSPTAAVPATQQKPGAAAPSANAQNRLDKMITAASQPPDVNGFGTTGTVTGELTEDAVSKMSEDQLAKLTPEQLAKFGVM